MLPQSFQTRHSGRARLVSAGAAFPRLCRGTLFAPAVYAAHISRPNMTLKLWILAGGLLAFAAAGSALRASRSRSKRFTADQLSGDWLAQARAREEHEW